MLRSGGGWDFQRDEGQFVRTEHERVNTRTYYLWVSPTKQYVTHSARTTRRKTTVNGSSIQQLLQQP